MALVETIAYIAAIIAIIWLLFKLGSLIVRVALIGLLIYILLRIFIF